MKKLEVSLLPNHLKTHNLHQIITKPKVTYAKHRGLCEFIIACCIMILAVIRTAVVEYFVGNTVGGKVWHTWWGWVEISERSRSRAVCDQTILIMTRCTISKISSNLLYIELEPDHQCTFVKSFSRDALLLNTIAAWVQLSILSGETVFQGQRECPWAR